MPADNVGILSQPQIDSFHDKGFLIADFKLDPLLLDAIVEKVYPYYPEEFRLNPKIPARVQDAWKKVDEVRQLAIHPKITQALQQLFQRKPLAFQTLNFPIGTSQRAHSDTVHFNSIPKGNMAGVWVALEDIDTDNGPLLYYPGSHKLREYSMQDFGLQPGYAKYFKYEICMQGIIKEHNLRPEYGFIKKGEALIWHANLLHGGAPQLESSRSRHSQVTHFYFEGCRYYTPMNSSARKLAYRYPFWIPESADFILPEDRPRWQRLLLRLKNNLRLERWKR